MTAIHQQKREVKHEIQENLTAYYRDLPRSQLEDIAVQLARIVAVKMSLADLKDWRDKILDTMACAKHESEWTQ